MNAKKSTPTRRQMLTRIAAAPATLLVAPPAMAAIGTAATDGPVSIDRLFAELDSINRETKRLNARPASETEWDRWERRVNRVWHQIEALPAIPEHAQLKARCAISISEGALEEAVPGKATCSSLIRQVVTILGGPY